MKKEDGPSLSWPTPHTTPFFLPPEDPYQVLLRPNSTPHWEPHSPRQAATAAGWDGAREATTGPQGERQRGHPQVAAPRPHTHAGDALRQLTIMAHFYK
jgi:hypothetical protein